MNRSKDYDIPACLCPHCGKDFDLVSATSKECGAPQAGEYSICISCLKWCVFGADLILQKPTPTEQERIDKEPDCRRCEYAMEIALMVARGRNWLSEHKDAMCQLRFNFPDGKIHLVAIIDDAVKHGYLNFNEDGKALLNEMNQTVFEGRNPTVQMLKIALANVVPDQA